jgi:5-dehydro-2-deoxygluconokinase
LLEVIPTSDQTIDETTLPRSLNRLYELGIRPDWWKLPPLSDVGWNAVGQIIDKQDPHCCGVVLLGLDAPMSQVKDSFGPAARHSHCKGFTVGRTLFAQPCREWLAGRLKDEELVNQVANNYAELIHEWHSLRQSVSEKTLKGWE